MFNIKDVKKVICDIHGEYQSSLWEFKGSETWSGCLECAKVRLALEHKERCIQGAKERQQLIIQSLLKRSAIPMGFENVNFDNFSTKILN